jgi:SEC-C motif domain protein
MMINACPCGLKRDYTHCCGPLITGIEHADTPEQLMRSRYTAYTLGDEKYIQSTWHPKTRPIALEHSTPNLDRWVCLEVIESQIFLERMEGFVRFKATSISANQLFILTENSRFIRQSGRWLYVDGDCQSHQAKISRNAPCPCGSGQKFKRCCA